MHYQCIEFEYSLYPHDKTSMILNRIFNGTLKIVVDIKFSLENPENVNKLTLVGIY